MIPFTLHYCWFGKGPLPKLVQDCMDSWQQKMPDIQIKCWNESNVPISEHKFMKDAYELKKYAFVSDYARYLILEKEGGIFLDCDVEVLKTFRPLIECPENRFFVGFEKKVPLNEFYVNPGLVMASEPGHPILRKVLETYDELSFVNATDGKPDLSLTSPCVLTKFLFENYNLKLNNETQLLQDGTCVYSSYHFAPINPRFFSKRKFEIKEETFSIHRGAASWVSSWTKAKTICSIILHRILRY